MCLVIGVFQFVNIPPSLKEAIALATTRKPETFTELYFENHLSLPNKVIYYQPQAFKFTIHNLENQNMEYPYEVYIDVNGEKQFIDQGSVLLKNNGYKTISEDFSITLPTLRVKLVINLVNKNQEIRFWIGEK